MHKRCSIPRARKEHFPRHKCGNNIIITSSRSHVKALQQESPSPSASPNLKWYYHLKKGDIFASDNIRATMAFPRPQKKIPMHFWGQNNTADVFCQVIHGWRRATRLSHRMSDTKKDFRGQVWAYLPPQEGRHTCFVFCLFYIWELRMKFDWPIEVRAVS